MQPHILEERIQLLQYENLKIRLTSCSLYILSDRKLQCCEIFKIQKPLLFRSSIWIPICTSARSSNFADLLYFVRPLGSSATMLRNFQNSKTSSISFIHLDPHLYLCDVLKFRRPLVVCTSSRIVSYNAAKFSEFKNLFYFVHPFGSPSVPLRCPQNSTNVFSLYILSDRQLQCCEIFKIHKPLLFRSSIWIPTCTSAMSSNFADLL